MSHYCNIDCIDEILIQDQNWSVDATLFLLRKVAEYVDEYGVKIVVLPSQFKYIEGENKNAQFLHYGEAVIRNRILQFVKDSVFIGGAMDEVIYGESYQDTSRKLEEFEELAEDRSDVFLGTVGFVPLYGAFKEGIFPQAVALDHVRAKQGVKPNWRHRILCFPMPFRRNPDGFQIHDTTYQVEIRGLWFNATPLSSFDTKEEITLHEHCVPLDLKLIHYHPLVRPEFESAKYKVPKREEIEDIDQHPSYYISELLDQL